MGVTISRNNKNNSKVKVETNSNNGTATSTGKPLEEFKRVSTRVGRIGVMAREARLKSQARMSTTNNGYHHHHRDDHQRAMSTDSGETATTMLTTTSPVERDRLMSDPDIDRDGRLMSDPDIDRGHMILDPDIDRGSHTMTHTDIMSSRTMSDQQVNDHDRLGNRLDVDVDNMQGVQRRMSRVQFYDGSEPQGHHLVYKDTTDAWAALRAGNVVSDVNDIPDTEISVVESTLSGYHTVEKTQTRSGGGGGRSGDSGKSETEVDSGNDSSFVVEGVRDDSTNNELESFVIPFADGLEPLGWKEKITSHTKCGICVTHTGHELYPCRICQDVFHEDCLRRRGKLHDDDSIKSLRAANTNLGWSCHECENIGRLLSDDEMFELMETFERCDVDSDATISLEEFIEYRHLVLQGHEGRELTTDEVEEESRYFKAMDTDRTGTLSWWEFLNHEAIRRMAGRTKKKLVSLLTSKEIQKLRLNFTAFDTDGDECITDYEARRAFKNWFSKFIDDPNEMSPSGQRRLGSQVSLRMATELSSHVSTNASLLMSADRDRSGSVSWQEYLMEQALYTLAVRPNIGAVQIHRRPTFCHD